MAEAQLSAAGLADFTAERFDAAAFLSNAVRARAGLPAALARLQGGVALLDGELKREVAAVHGDALEAMRASAEVEAELGAVRAALEAAAGSIGALKGELARPHLALRAQAAEQARAYAAVELLRKVVRFQALAARLRPLFPDLADPRELPKAAAALRELQLLQAEGDLAGVAALAPQAAWLATAHQALVNRAAALLAAAAEGHAQADVALALQTFAPLGLLDERVRALVNGLADALTAALPPLHTLPPPSSPALRAALWTLLERLAERVHAATTQVWLLYRILGRLREPATHAPLLEAAATEAGPRDFWRRMCAHVGAYLAQVAAHAPAVEQVLVAEYVRVAGVFEELLRRLRAHYELKQPGAALAADQAALLLAALARFEKAFLARSLARLLDALNALFPAAPRPLLPDDAALLARHLTAELEQGRADPRLLGHLARGVAKALRVVHAKAEGAAAWADDAYAFAPDQPALPLPLLRNASLYLCLRHLHTSLAALLPSLPPAAAEPLAEPLAALDALAAALVRPLFTRATRLLERSLLQLHLQLDAALPRPAAPGAALASPYVQAVAALVAHLTGTVLPPFGHTPQAAALRSRAVQLFTRHAALVRAWSEETRLRCAADISQMELALAPLPGPARHAQPDAPAPAEWHAPLRALKQLLFLDDAQIAAFPLLPVLPPAVALLHLFSRAPPQLAAPPAALGLSVAQFSDWLDEHTDEELWALVARLLDEYAQRVNARGDAHFAPVYPVFFHVARAYRLLK